jgi:hypothetical protein
MTMKRVLTQPAVFNRSEVGGGPFQEIRLRIIEELNARDGILMAFTELEDEESTIFIIMDREEFDEELELQVYDLQERLMNDWGVPLSFVCLPRIALQEGVPGTLAEVLVNRDV